ncbi:unnamed protein product, partial [Rotaria sp. Silwood2]
IFQTTLNALEFLTTQTYQNLSTIFRNLVRNSINSSFNFLPLVFTIPSGEVTVVVKGKNYSIPQLQLPLIDKINNN